MKEVTCPNCGTESETPEEAAGRRISCEQCDEHFAIPGTPPATRSGRTRRPRSKAVRVEPPPETVAVERIGPPSVEASAAPAVAGREEQPAPTKEQEKPDDREQPETKEKAPEDGAQRQPDDREPRAAREGSAADETAWLATRGDIGRLLEQVRRIDDKLVTIRWAVIASIVVLSVTCLVAILKAM